jgi:hypothetical protein
MRERPVAI